MAKPKVSNAQFEFKADSATKLVMFPQNGGKPDVVYSFDGRITKSGRIKIWDDPKFQSNEAAGIEYLKQLFQNKYSTGDFRSVYIATKDYDRNNGQMICRYANGCWTNAAAAVTPVAPLENYFLCKMWLPVATGNMVFYTRDVFPLENLRFQYQKWRKANAQAVIKGFGLLYGSTDGELYLPTDKNVPRIYSYYFDWQSENFYHNQTRRVAGVNEF
jgi:hypothetical protein